MFPGGSLGCGTAQDDPFDIILWYIGGKVLLFGIGPINDVELICIFQPVVTLCTFYRI